MKILSIAFNCRLSSFSRSFLVHDIICPDLESDVMRSICRFHFHESPSTVDANFPMTWEIDYLPFSWLLVIAALLCSSVDLAPTRSPSTTTPLASICCASVIRSLIDVAVTSQYFCVFDRHTLLLLETDTMEQAVGQAVGQADVNGRFPEQILEREQSPIFRPLVFVSGT